jgi:hypothetical protein
VEKEVKTAVGVRDTPAVLLVPQLFNSEESEKLKMTLFITDGSGPT